MNKEFELSVESTPTPDAEERLRRIFDLLLTPLSNHEQQLYGLECDQTYEGSNDPTKSTRQTLIKNRVDRT